MNDTSSAPPKRQGLKRVWHAFFYSAEGLRAGWSEPAFRQEAVLAFLILPGAWWLGQSWIEMVLLVGVVVAVLVAGPWQTKRTHQTVRRKPAQR